MVRRCSRCNSRVRRIWDGSFECSVCGKNDTEHRVTIHLKEKPSNLTPQGLYKFHYEDDFIFKELVDKCMKICEELNLPGKIRAIPYKSVLSLRYKQSIERQYMFLSVDYPKYSPSTSEYRLKVRFPKFRYVKDILGPSDDPKFRPLLDLIEKTDGAKINEHGWGGYNEFVVRKVDDLEEAVNLAKGAISNLAHDWEILREELFKINPNRTDKK